VPALRHGGVTVWDTLAIAEYLNEVFPKAGLLPGDRKARAHCRSICGEMHSGFANLRSSLPMNLKARHQGFKVWAGAQGDIDRVTAIWRECLSAYGGPYLFGAGLTVADAMYAPVCARFHTYDVKLDADCSAYVTRILALPQMVEWTTAASGEPEELQELEVEF
jgi:glutathione S-transferase